MSRQRLVIFNALAPVLLIATMGCVKPALRPTVHPGFSQAADDLSADGWIQYGPIYDSIEDDDTVLPIRLSHNACYAFVALLKDGDTKPLPVTIQDIAEPHENSTQSMGQTYPTACVHQTGPHLIKVQHEGRPYRLKTWRRPMTGLSPNGSCAEPTPLPLDRFVTVTLPALNPDGTDRKNTSKSNSQSSIFAFTTQGDVSLSLSAHNTQHLEVKLSPKCGDEPANSPIFAQKEKRNQVVFKAPFLPAGTYYLSVVNKSSVPSIKMGIHTQLTKTPSRQQKCQEALFQKENEGHPHRQTFVTEFRVQQESAITPIRFKIDAPSRVAIYTNRGKRIGMCLESGCPTVSSNALCHSVSTYFPLYTQLIPGEYSLYINPGNMSLNRSISVIIDASALSKPAVKGDTMADAMDISVSNKRQEVYLDTIEATDQHQSAQIGDNAPDLFYRFTLNTPKVIDTRIAATAFPAALCLISPELSPHAKPICALHRPDEENESIRTQLSPGTYYLVVDGEKPNDYGRAAFTLEFEDIP